MIPLEMRKSRELVTTVSHCVDSYASPDFLTVATILDVGLGDLFHRWTAIDGARETTTVEAVQDHDFLVLVQLGKLFDEFFDLHG
jgi:hypothetical protein